MKISDNGKILLHACCAPCSTSCIERLQNNNYEVILYFSNSNMDSEQEFDKRLESQKKVANHFKVKLYVDKYDHCLWLKYIYGFEDAPEKGTRCSKCFEFNFSRTAIQAQRLQIKKFTTTLTVSPHKESKMIFNAGSNFPDFEKWDFKKENGFKRSLEISETLNLYRQKYCGCEFSRR